MNFFPRRCFPFVLELQIPYKSTPCFLIFEYLICVADRHAFQKLSLEDFETSKELFGNLSEWKTWSIAK